MKNIIIITITYEQQHIHTYHDFYLYWCVTDNKKKQKKITKRSNLSTAEPRPLSHTRQNKTLMYKHKWIVQRGASKRQKAIINSTTNFIREIIKTCARMKSKVFNERRNFVGLKFKGVDYSVELSAFKVKFHSTKHFEKINEFVKEPNHWHLVSISRNANVNKQFIFFCQTNLIWAG